MTRTTATMKITTIMVMVKIVIRNARTKIAKNAITIDK